MYLNESLPKKVKTQYILTTIVSRGICFWQRFTAILNADLIGPLQGLTTCQLHMRSFSDGPVITIEPWRAKAFPVV